MKKIVVLAEAVLVMLALTVKAGVPVFGNQTNGNSGFEVSIYNQLSLEGGAVAFTPLENIYLDSVTLWFSGYNGDDGQRIQASIWMGNNSYPSTPFIDFSSPLPNDGSLAAFTFCNPSGNPAYNPSDSDVLMAETEYWLVVTASGQPGNYEVGATWAGGGNPSGEATLGGLDEYNVYGSSFSRSSIVPAFMINAAPEPASWAIMMLPALLRVVERSYIKCRNGAG